MDIFRAVLSVNSDDPHIFIEDMQIYHSVELSVSEDKNRGYSLLYTAYRGRFRDEGCIARTSAFRTHRRAVDVD